MNKYINPFLKEIIPIIVGILIALNINNWNENRKEKEYISQISSSIKKELAETHKDIDEILSSQKSFIDNKRNCKTLIQI